LRIEWTKMPPLQNFAALLLIYTIASQVTMGLVAVPVVLAVDDAGNTGELDADSRPDGLIELEKRRSNELFGKRTDQSYDRPIRRGHELFGKRSVFPAPPQEQIPPAYIVVSGFPDYIPASLSSKARLFLERLSRRYQSGALKLSSYAQQKESHEEDLNSEKVEKVVLKRRGRELFGKRSAPAVTSEWEEGEPELQALIDALIVKQRPRRARGGELFG